MKGYFTGTGYMGLIDGSYQLFASEEEYIECYEDQQYSIAPILVWIYNLQLGM